MKQNDIAYILIIVFISGVLSIFLSGIIVGSPSREKQSVEVVEPITADFIQPSSDYFNDQSINPTKIIEIEDNAPDAGN